MFTCLRSPVWVQKHVTVHLFLDLTSQANTPVHVNVNRPVQVKVSGPVLGSPSAEETF